MPRHSLNDYAVFEHQSYKTSSVQSTHGHSTSLATNSEINPFGFIVCRNLTQLQRVKAYIGLFVVCNKQPIRLLTRVSGARGRTVEEMVDVARVNFLLDVSIENGRISVSDMGPMLNDDPSRFVQYAFPTGVVNYRSTTYQLF